MRPDWTTIDWVAGFPLEVDPARADEMAKGAVQIGFDWAMVVAQNCSDFAGCFGPVKEVSQNCFDFAGCSGLAKKIAQNCSGLAYFGLAKVVVQNCFDFEAYFGPVKEVVQTRFDWMVVVQSYFDWADFALLAKVVVQIVMVALGLMVVVFELMG